MQYKYSVNGTTYLIPEEQVDAFLQQFPNAQLIETVGDEAGKQTGVAEPAAAVAPESEAADTASESEDTSLVSPDPAATVDELPGRPGLIQWGIDTANAVYTGLESGFLAEDYIDVLNKTADTDDYQRIANAAQRLAKVPPSRAMVKFMKDAEDAGGGIGGWYESTKNNGIAVGSQVFLQSMAIITYARWNRCRGRDRSRYRCRCRKYRAGCWYSNRGQSGGCNRCNKSFFSVLYSYYRGSIKNTGNTGRRSRY